MRMKIVRVQTMINEQQRITLVVMTYKYAFKEQILLKIIRAFQIK